MLRLRPVMSCGLGRQEFGRAAVRGVCMAVTVLLVSVDAQAEADSFHLGDGHHGSLVVQGRMTADAGGLVAEDVAAGESRLVVSAEAINDVPAGSLILLLPVSGSPPQANDAGLVELTDSELGRWEFARVAAAGDGALILSAPLERGFSAGTLVVPVLELQNLTIADGGQWLVPPFDGARGGVLVALVSGEVVNEGVVDASGSGFLGGTGRQGVVDAGCADLDAASPLGGERGRGFEPWNASVSRSPVALGGGGGGCSNSGGGGGSHRGRGGRGGPSRDGYRDVGGRPGLPIAYQPGARLVFGGGGGAGWSGNYWDFATGGRGGGVVWVRARRITGSGAWRADGAPGRNFGGIDYGLGGGGAGGTVILMAQSSVRCGAASARGGNGGGGNNYAGGQGGGGGGGLIYLQGIAAASCPASVASGTGGITGNGRFAGEPQSSNDPSAIGMAASATQGFAAPPPPAILSPLSGTTTSPRPRIEAVSYVDGELALVIDGLEAAVRSVPPGPAEFSLVKDLAPGPHLLEVAGRSEGLEYGRSLPTAVIVGGSEWDTPTVSDGPLFLSTPLDVKPRCGRPWNYDDDGRVEFRARVGGVDYPRTFSIEPEPGWPLPVRLGIEPALGEVRWTPSVIDRGEQRFVLVARSTLGEARQRVVVNVDCPVAAAVGFGCSHGGLPLPPWLQALAMLGLAAAALRERRAARIAAMALAVIGLCPTMARAEPDGFLFGTGRDGVLTVDGGDTVTTSAGGRLLRAASMLSLELEVTAMTAGPDDLVMLWTASGQPHAGVDGGFIDARASALGRWELARLRQVQGQRFILQLPLLQPFPAGTQVVRVLELSHVEISDGGTLRAPAFDGFSGGLLAVLVSGEFINDGSVTASGAGGPKGAARLASTMSACGDVDEAFPGGAERGHGVEAWVVGTGRGATSTGGGGGVCRRAGGGGGGHVGRGGRGGNSHDGDRPVGGEGGAAVLYEPGLQLFFGGGGGAGWTDWTVVTPSNGASGGGVLWVRAQRIRGAGRWSADGDTASSFGGIDYGLGGGGAGGSVLLRAKDSIDCLSVSANGGSGGGGNNFVGGNGGGGAGGLVFLQGAPGGSCSGEALAGRGGVTHVRSIPAEPTRTDSAQAIGRVIALASGFGSPSAPVIASPTAGQLRLPPLVVSGNAAASTRVRLLIDLTPEVEADVSGGAFSLQSSRSLTAGAHVLEVAGLEQGVEYARSAPVVVYVVESANVQSSDALRILSTPVAEVAACGKPWLYDDDGKVEVDVGAEVDANTRVPVRFSIEAYPGAPLPTRLAIEPSTGALRWTPSTLDLGMQRFDIVARSAFHEARQTVEVDVRCALPAVGCGCASSVSGPGARDAGACAPDPSFDAGWAPTLCWCASVMVLLSLVRGRRRRQGCG